MVIAAEPLKLVAVPVTAPDIAIVRAVVKVAALPPILKPAAVPVMFVPTKADGVPSAGVTRVGLVANTADPVPVSFVRAVSSCKEVNDPRDVAFPTEVTAPVKLAFVALFPFNFCIACKIESVAATVPAPDTYPVRTLAITGAFVKVVALPTEVTSPVKLALVTTVVALPTEVTPPVKLALVTTVVALPTEDTPPVKLAFVVTLLAVKAVAVPVMFVPTSAEGVPSAGVTRVGLVANTADPVPVSFVRAVSSCKEVNDPRDVAFPTEVTAPVKLAFVTTVAALPIEVTPPVKLAFVVTLLAVKAVAVPVMFVPTKADGVPSAGVTSVGLFDKTTATVPVDDVTPVPPLATGRVPLTWVAMPILP
jgi:hypothetical protein